MKKIVALFLSFVMLAVFTGCRRERPLSGREQLVADTVNRFMEERGRAMAEQLAEAEGESFNVPQVMNAMDFSCSDFYGYNVEYMYINLWMATKENGNKVQVQLCLDKNSGRIYDDTRVTSEFCHTYYNSEEHSREIEATMSTGRYKAYIDHGGKDFYSGTELKSEFSKDMLKAVNNALANKEK